MLHLRHQICWCRGHESELRCIAPNNLRRRAEKHANLLTLNYCDEVLKKNGMNLDDDVLKELRGYLYFLAGLQIEDETAKEGQDYV